MERTNSIGAEQVSGFDVDSAGNSYVLHGGSRLTEFNSEGEFRRTLRSAKPRWSRSRYRAAGRSGSPPDGGLRFLEGSGGGFTLAAYPSPWLLFAMEPDRVGVLRAEGPTLHVFRFEDGDASDASMVLLGANAPAGSPIAGQRQITKAGSICLVSEGASTHVP